MTWAKPEARGRGLITKLGKKSVRTRHLCDTPEKLGRRTPPISSAHQREASENTVTCRTVYAGLGRETYVPLQGGSGSGRRTGLGEHAVLGRGRADGRQGAVEGLGLGTGLA